MLLHGLVLVLLLIVIASLTGFIFHRFLSEREQARNELQQLNTDLEQRIANRMRDLQLAAEVSRQITTILNLEDLLRSVVRLTRDHFNLYGAHIFLFDETTHHLILSAGVTAERDLLPDSDWFEIALGAEPSLVALAARTHEVISTGDVTNDPRFLSHPDASNTRSEMTVPLLYGQKLIGVLDLHSTRPQHFTPHEVHVMKTLAGQIAIAVVNARLFAQQVQVTEKLKLLDTLKSQFIANFSHELRTPLNVVLNIMGFMIHGVYGSITPPQTDALQTAIRNAEHLMSLLNDILDMSKIEANMMELLIAPFDLKSLLQDITMTAHELAQSGSTEIITQFADNLPIIEGDQRRLRQVLLNLVANAIKFTPQGSVMISAQQDGNSVHLRVQDTGIGISPEDQQHIFEAFRQVKQEPQTIPGTGLGLPISKYLVEAHGGKLWLESTVNVGSTFHVVLPLKGRVSDTMPGEQDTSGLFG